MPISKPLSDEKYFDSLLCVECQTNYWSDEKTKLCKKCLRKKRHNEKVMKMEVIMIKKQKQTKRKKLEMPANHK
jgi:hypothetical protein